MAGVRRRDRARRVFHWRSRPHSARELRLPRQVSVAPTRGGGRDRHPRILRGAGCAQRAERSVTGGHRRGRRIASRWTGEPGCRSDTRRQIERAPHRCRGRAQRFAADRRVYASQSRCRRSGELCLHHRNAVPTGLGSRESWRSSRLELVRGPRARGDARAECGRGSPLATSRLGPGVGGALSCRPGGVVDCHQLFAARGSVARTSAAPGTRGSGGRRPRSVQLDSGPGRGSGQPGLRHRVRTGRRLAVPMAPH